MATVFNLTERRARREARRFAQQSGPVFAHLSQGSSSLTASGAKLDLTSRTEARRVRQLRQGWQQDAWAYRDTIGEIRYAVEFKAHCASRMRLFPAVYPAGKWDDEPVPMVDAKGVPAFGVSQQAIDSAQNALNMLGTGREAIAEMLSSLSTNFSVAGECYFVGLQNPADGSESWTVRSIDELMVRNDQYAIREVPLDPQGVFGWIELNPETDFVSRVWTAHPRFRILPDSPMRSILDDCESLLILRRGIRATGRSRLAGAGMLLLSDGLSLVSTAEETEDAEAQPLLGKLTDAMMTPIGDEGTASAVVPIVLQGSPEALKEVRQLFLDRKLDPEMAAQRTELIGVIATGFDLPKEVIVGMADLNHWTAWQVDDNTFRHHVEQHIIDCVTALTVGYLRVSMIADGIDAATVARSVVWYDATELLTHPDRTADAIQLYNMRELSGAALRRVTGFNELDKPGDLEIVTRALASSRTWPVNAQLAVLARLDPSLVIPAISGAGIIPGVRGGLANVPELPPGPAASSPGAAEPSSAASAPPSPVELPASKETVSPGPASTAPPSVTASVDDESARLSHTLAEIDHDVRARLQVTANAAMSRVLDRAGAKLRTKVQASRSPQVIPFKSLLRPVVNSHVAQTLGETIVAALGFSASELTSTDWSDVHVAFDHWVAAAQHAALSTAAKIARVAPDDPSIVRTAAAQHEARHSAWSHFAAALSARAAQLLYDPDPRAEPEPWANNNPETLVPPGIVRTALALAGGPALAVTPTPAVTSVVAAISSSGPVGQIGTGSTIVSFLTSAGAAPAQFEWKHGAPLHPFEPHLDLNGVQYSSWSDPALQNTGSFPSNEYFAPGDHDGCTCDFVILWTPGAYDQGGSTDVTLGEGTPVGGTSTATQTAVETQVAAPPSFQFASTDARGNRVYSFGQSRCTFYTGKGWSVDDEAAQKIALAIDRELPGSEVHFGVNDRRRSLARASIFGKNPRIEFSSRDVLDGATGTARRNATSHWWMPEVTTDNAFEFVAQHELGHALSAFKSPLGDVFETTNKVRMALSQEFGLRARPISDAIGEFSASAQQKLIAAGLSRYGATTVQEAIAESHASWVYGGRSPVVMLIARMMGWSANG